jgi:hypothetical protein
MRALEIGCYEVGEQHTATESAQAVRGTVMGNQGVGALGKAPQCTAGEARREEGDAAAVDMHQVGWGEAILNARLRGAMIEKGVTHRGGNVSWMAATPGISGGQVDLRVYRNNKARGLRGPASSRRWLQLRGVGRAADDGGRGTAAPPAADEGGAGSARGARAVGAAGQGRGGGRCARQGTHQWRRQGVAEQGALLVPTHNYYSTDPLPPPLSYPPPPPPPPLLPPPINARASLLSDSGGIARNYCVSWLPGSEPF